MSRLRRGAIEPRVRVERITGFADLLRSIPENHAKVFVAWVVYGASADVIGEKLGLGPVQISSILRRTASLLRHPSRSQPFRDLVFSDGMTLMIDSGLRALLREWRLEELFAPTCTQCGSRYVPEQQKDPWPTGGRPRQYCSNACRQKAYRQRHRQAGRSSADRG